MWDLNTLRAVPTRVWGWTGLGAGALAALGALSGAAWAVVPALAAGGAGAAAAFTAHQPRPRPVQARSDARVHGLSELTPLLEALPEPALLVNEEGRIAGSNAAARRQFEFEAAGLFLSALLRHPDLLDAVKGATHDGATRTVEYETTAQVEEHIRCYVAPVTWGADRAALMVFHDQTARINTERMRSDFLANASHELRTPLASLTLLLETVLGPARDTPADRDRFLGMMQIQADRMRRLIDDLLSLSRIELNEHVPPSDRADLALVAREVADTLSPVARDRQVELRVSAQEPAIVVGERFQLAQVVQNLVDNAIKYTDAGSSVLIEVGRAESREAVLTGAGRRWEEAGRISLLTPAPTPRAYAFVRVTDSGPGVSRRFLPRLGERFFRVEREEGDDRGGTGLGLAIVKHIVNRHRGGLMVESQPGRGSAFIAYVELAGETRAPARSAPASISH